MLYMTRDDVIKTYLANFNLYKDLLSIDEQIDDHKNLTYICAKNPLLMIKEQDIAIIKN